MPKGSGRRPLPTQIKKLRGNAGKRKLNDAEPMPAAIEPQIPAGLPKLAVAEWKSIVPELLQLGVLSRIDGKALAAYCCAFSRWRQAEEDVEKYGITIEEPVVDPDTGEQRVLGAREVKSKGGIRSKIGGAPLVRLKRNPAISVAHDAMKLMKSFLVEFGMTPAARTRIRIEKPPGADDPLEALLKRNAANAEKAHVN